jgi:hypothetical protein
MGPRSVDRGKRPLSTAQKPLGSVGKTDYVSELIGGARTDSDRLDKQTTLSNDIQKRLKESGGVDQVKVSPWGYVFGLRKDDGTWIFELVKCVSLEYYKVRLKARFLRSAKRIPEGETRVKALSSGGGSLAINPNSGQIGFKKFQIADAGPAQVTYDPIGPDDYSEEKIMDCKAIAYQPFFPGQGQTISHDISGAQLYNKLIV